ncbi:hypothetical protein OCU04_004550 [Sclerotinia nivalis]|uniref:Uncharacterized protein n=1 Tax=Sclerotinia nivalis TaxID=352851 RepID=A0A9X0DKR1_9HELO|nr:hypothetical protein OCU04_004550 [Sclerotinia nivalis]
MKHTANNLIKSVPRSFKMLHIDWFGDDKYQHRAAACFDGFFFHARFLRRDYRLQYTNDVKGSEYPLSPMESRVECLRYFVPLERSVCTESIFEKFRYHQIENWDPKNPTSHFPNADN